jgi:hypothetical protein
MRRAFMHIWKGELVTNLLSPKSPQYLIKLSKKAKNVVSCRASLVQTKPVGIASASLFKLLCCIYYLRISLPQDALSHFRVQTPFENFLGLLVKRSLTSRAASAPTLLSPHTTSWSSIGGPSTLGLDRVGIIPRFNDSPLHP